VPCDSASHRAVGTHTWWTAVREPGGDVARVNSLGLRGGVKIAEVPDRWRRSAAPAPVVRGAVGRRTRARLPGAAGVRGA
jgi:hypothetical protein